MSAPPRSTTGARLTQRDRALSVAPRQRRAHDARASHSQLGADEPVWRSAPRQLRHTARRRFRDEATPAANGDGQRPARVQAALARFGSARTRPGSGRTPSGGARTRSGGARNALARPGEVSAGQKVAEFGPPQGRSGPPARSSAVGEAKTRPNLASRVAAKTFAAAPKHVRAAPKPRTAVFEGVGASQGEEEPPRLVASFQHGGSSPLLLARGNRGRGDINVRPRGVMRGTFGRVRMAEARREPAGGEWCSGARRPRRSGASHGGQRASLMGSVTIATRRAFARIGSRVCSRTTGGCRGCARSTRATGPIHHQAGRQPRTHSSA